MGRCAICGNQKDLEIIRAKELFIGLRQIFDYIDCPKCKSLSINNIPNNLNELYAKYPVFEFDISRSSAIRNFLRRYIVLNQGIFTRFFSYFLDSWEDLAFKALQGLNLKTSMKILDVGCGNGLLIRTLREFGFQNLTGIDPHLKHPDSQLGCRFLKETIYSVNEQFDVVMCHHTFEHMEDIFSAAKRLEELVRPGGWLIIRIPNIESYSYRKYRQFWHGIHAPFHYVLPSYKGMDLIFKNSNLKMIERRQEQLVELFLYNIQLSLDIALLEPQGVLSYIGDRPLGNKLPPPFTTQDIANLKKKVKSVLKCNMADYVGYYYRKDG